MEGHVAFGVAALVAHRAMRLPSPPPPFCLSPPIMIFPLIPLLFLAAPAAPDTLVVCPAEFRAALTPWEAHRHEQGHRILVIDVPLKASQLQETIRRVAQDGALKYLVLIGDVPSNGPDSSTAPSKITIPTNYIASQVNKRWASEPTIASDASYADTDADGLPNLAIGRIPADSAAELATVVQKILRYEQGTDHGPWERQLNIVAGVGGFGLLADALVEAAGRQVIHATVPECYLVSQTMASPSSPPYPPAGHFKAHICAQFKAGSLAWVYLGHGLPLELDHVRTSRGEEPILSVGDVPKLRCGAQSPLAVLIACYTGAFDAHRDCLAEELLIDSGGPVAVIAATRVTMPYGNTVLGYELLRAGFNDCPAELGEILRLAKARTLQTPATNAVLRTSLDAIAQGISPPPVDLSAERHEHVAMYHLLGDPLLRWRRPGKLEVFAPAEVTAGEPINIALQTEMAGDCWVELVSAGDSAAVPLAQKKISVDRGKIRLSLGATSTAAGAYIVRAFVAGRETSAAGSTRILVRKAAQRLSKANVGDSATK